MRLRLFLVCALAAAISLLPSAKAQSSPAAPSSSATSIPDAQLIQAADLQRLINGDAGSRPVILQVGSHVFFQEAHVQGSKYAGPGSQPAGLALLENTVASLPKDKFIVLYCGCCPWNRCPNVGPAFKRLHDLGYSNVKVLYIANNFGDDWVNKGYPTEK